MIRKALYLILSVFTSAGLILSIPVISILLDESFSLKKNPRINKTEIERIIMPPPPRQQKKIRKTPRRLKSSRMTGKSGPRFAMALGAQGVGGVSVPANLTNRSSGEEGTGDAGVDERPSLMGSFNLDVPDAVRRAEVDASLRLMFCVDVSGRPYDIKVTEENPTGFGLAEAGIEALKKVVFKPAVRNDQSVAFCGMEQPVEIKFRN